MEFDLLIANGTLVSADEVFHADVGINGQTISAVLPPNHAARAGKTLDARGCYVIPGAVDGHVHLNLRTGTGMSADDWLTGTRAAALGGVTAVVDFVDTAADEQLTDALAKRIAEAQPAVIDYGLHMTIQPDGDPHPASGALRAVSAERLAQIRSAADAGCASFKLYMAYAGYQLRDGDLLRAMRAIHDVNGLACVHAENGEVIDVLRQSVTDDPRNASLHARTRPAINEAEAVARAIMCAELSGAQTLIFHISCQTAAQGVADAKKRGIAHIYGETCPHYLILTDDMLARGDGCLYICAPPLRKEADQDALWGMLATSALDVISTDHCPFTRAQKEAGAHDFRAVPGGLPGIETRLGLMHHFGVRAGRLGLSEWVRLCCARPAELMGFANKGRIAPGYDADVVVFDPGLPMQLSSSNLHSSIDWSAYADVECMGWTRDVIARGDVLVESCRLQATAGRGQYVKRSL